MLEKKKIKRPQPHMKPPTIC